jgi:uncharacterized protein YebE (UPF0316 family)
LALLLILLLSTGLDVHLINSLTTTFLS